MYTDARARRGLPILVALLAHVPCCGPVVLAAVGGTSVSAGWLSWLEPARPFLVALACVQVLALFAWARWGRQPDCCEKHLTSARRRRYRIAWLTLVFVLVVNAAGFWVDRAVHNVGSEHHHALHD
jgi:hypothetical protein